MREYKVIVEFTYMLDTRPFGAVMQAADILKESAHLLEYKVIDMVTKDKYEINLETNECRRCNEHSP